jgi:hypothetical protein
MSTHCAFCAYLGHSMCASCGGVAFAGQQYRGAPECAYCEEDRLAGLAAPA